MKVFSRGKGLFLRATAGTALVAGLAGSVVNAQSTPDELVLVNGDTLHGKLVSETSGTVTFNTDELGNVTVPWAKIKELHSNQKFSVIPKGVELSGKKKVSQVPTGTIDVQNQAVTVSGPSAPSTPIPVADATYIVDAPTVDKLLHHEPSFTQGWNGSATAGATIVAASQNQYTVSAAVGLVRSVPNVPWLNPRNRTAVDFAASYGKITQPGYTYQGVYTPEVITKSSILHADLERDKYFSPRMYALVMASWDHNYAQSLDLQQIYGGGLGYTVVKTPKQELDVKATIQYEKQAFSNGANGVAVTNTDSDTNIIGTTFGANYMLNLKMFTYTQQLAYIPAWNDTKAYSAAETNTLAFPAYKNLSFSVGTLDSYLNNAPITEPPTKRNSFQFTMGLTYAIKSKY